MKRNIRLLALALTIIMLTTCEKDDDPDPDTQTVKTSEYYGLSIKDHSASPGLTLLKAESYQQTTEYTCGPSAVITLLKYYNLNGDEMAIATEMGTSTTCGTTPEQMATWLNNNGFTASWQELGTLEMLRNNLAADKPTLVEWSDWGGHWVLVIGYDTRNTETQSDDVIIFADPYDHHDDHLDGISWFNAERFYYMWYDALLFGSVMRRIYITATPV